MTKDLTRGTPAKLILGFALPLVAGNLFQQVYTMIDTLIVGRFLGNDALAGVGSIGAVLFLFTGFMVGVTAGFSIPIAHRFGASDYGELRRFTGNAIWLSLFISVFLCVFTCVLCRPILLWTQTPAQIFEYAHAYLFLIFLGLPILFAYNLVLSILRSLGDSKTPLLFMLLAAALNIGLDLLFIVPFQLGTAGVALATLASQGIACIGCFVIIRKRFPVLHLQKADFKMQRRYVKRLLAVGLPMGLQYTITSVGNVLLQTAINGLGTVYVTAITVGARVSNLFTCVFDTLGATMAAYGGQNLGAGKTRRIRLGLRACLIYSFMYSAVSCLACLLLGKPILSAFMDRSAPLILSNAYQYLVISAVFFNLVGFVNIFRLLIQGLGYSKLAIFAGVFEMIGRSAAGLIFVPAFGFLGACFGSPLAWLLACGFLIPMYFLIMRRLPPERKEESPQ